MRKLAEDIKELGWYLLAFAGVLALFQIADALTDLADSYCSLADGFLDAA